MLTQMITETLLGALTGYITNNTAIRSLFQPGGVIEKTRDDFAREAGRLLEDQVLTQVVLAQQLQLPEVQQCLSQALENFLQVQLPQSLAQLRLSDLPDREARTAFLQGAFVQFLQQEREQILLLLQKHLPPQQILTERQSQRLIQQLERVLLETLQQEDLAVQLWHSWQTEKGQATMEQLGLAPFCQTILHNLARSSQQWPQLLQAQYGEALRSLLLETLQKLELRPVLLGLDQQMAGAVLEQYLRCDAKELQQLLLAVLQCAEGQSLMAFVAEQLVQTLETVDLPVGQVVPTALLEQLSPLLQQQIPAVLTQVLDWLQENRADVEVMLEEAVDEIATEAGGMKGMLLQQLKESVLQQVLQQTDFGELLQQFLCNEQTSEQAAAVLLAQITQVLQERKLGELVKVWNQKQRLQQMVQLLLTENLQHTLEQSGEELAAQLLAWQPGSLQLAEHQVMVEQWLAGFLLRNMKTLDLASLLQGQEPLLQQLTVQQILPVEDEQIEAWLNQGVSQACQQLAEGLPQVSAEMLYRPLYERFTQLAQQRGQTWIQQLAQQYTIGDLLQLAEKPLIKQQSQILAGITTIGLAAAQGRLNQLAEEQIQQLSNEEMLQLVEDFMGKELQPLNYLGAGMGAIAGATVGTALSAALPVTATANPALLVSILAGKAAVFGGVGYGTNCAAVKGLFWPYEPVGGIEMLQGVIPKQKSRFAHSMGQLVDRYVINEEVLQQLLQQHQPQWMAYAAQLAGNQGLMERLAAEVAAWRKPVVQTLLQWLEQQGVDSVAAVLERLGGMPLAFLRSSQLEPHALEQMVLPLAQQWLQNQLQAEVPLGQLLSAERFWQGVHGWVARQALPDLAQLCAKALRSEKSLQQLCTAEEQQTLLHSLAKMVTDWLAQPEHHATFAAWLSGFLEEQRLKQWLKQHSSAWLAQNLSSVFRLVEQAMLQLMQEKEERITLAIQQAILNRLGLMQQLGYSMMGGDEIVAQIVERVLHQKLPIFLSVKSRELQGLFAQCWQEQLFPALLQLPVSQKEMQGFLQTLLQQSVLHQCAGQIVVQTAQCILAKPVSAWGGWLQLDGMFERLQMQLGFQWQKNGAAALAHWQPLVMEFYGQQVAPITIRQLTRGFTGEIPLADMLQCAALPDLLAAFQLRLHENLAITRPQQWLHWSQLETRIEQGVATLLQDTAFRQWFCYEGELLILQMTSQWQQLLPEPSRVALTEPVVQALFAVAETYGSKLLTAMDLAQLAETQLLAMDSARLEQVVRGFASQYLVHIENRGWLGAVFALPGMLLYLL